jgi:hypothetical protein
LVKKEGKDLQGPFSREGTALYRLSTVATNEELPLQLDKEVK